MIKNKFPIKTFHSTRKFQLWQLCRNFSTKFWMIFVPESKIDETSQFPSKEKHAYPENVHQETSKTVLEILSIFFTSEIHFANFRKHFRLWQFCQISGTKFWIHSIQSPILMKLFFYTKFLFWKTFHWIRRMQF